MERGGFNLLERLGSGVPAVLWLLDATSEADGGGEDEPDGRNGIDEHIRWCI